MAISLSAIIITKNEEKHLARAIQSVREVVEEVVVVDSGSTDGTMALASQLADVAVFHQFEDFAKQYNFAASITKNAWVLSLDADEVLTPELQERIRKIKQEPHLRYAAFCFPRKTYDRNGNLLFTTNSYPGFHYRLYNRDLCWVRKPVHSSLEVRGKKKFYPEHLLHYPDYDRVPEKENLYNRMKQLPSEPRPRYTLLQTLDNFWWHFRALFIDLAFWRKGPKYWKHGATILFHLAGVRMKQKT
jgi:glycosyltransferase involved in cell wall biosynthesis